ncbi:hypothetical protein Clacol_008426 [Clathrus columnatus]|uniref:Uncharacterized protein n=1 Tax=Clathrus columnatus TaxID=1419009 RepID=A0AAV5AP43_9AGAM|nr:hypothetical protein Clacol_008426 [Clathrus columnatus]
MSPLLPHFPPLEPPTTPMMLYIGAGYDLSPLLTFSPHGPPYPIEPLNKYADFSYPAKDSYTSFIFVDAKPRHTYAFMVPDFEEWKDVDVRIKNVLYYSQGVLTRWRCVPGANDLIWFEGGGDDEHVIKRMSDPDWHCMPSSAAQSRPKTWLFSHKPIPDASPKPLVTVYYLFNTLDVEVTRSPRMERMWSRVEALYVHGLMIHRSTGSGLSPLSHSGISTPLPNPTGDRFHNGLGEGLKRVYVLVGSWSGKTGVRHVDFIKKGRARARVCTKKAAPKLHLHNRIAELALSPTDSFSTVQPAPSFSSTRITTVASEPDTDQIHIPPLTSHILHSPSVDIIPPADVEDGTEHHLLNIQRRPSIDSLCSVVSTSSCSYSDIYTPTTSQTFHIPIPQIAWLDKLNNGKGGYYVSMTVEDCVQVVQRQHREDSRSASKNVHRHEKGKLVPRLQDRRLWNLKWFAARSTSPVRQMENQSRPRLRFGARPNRLELNEASTRSSDKNTHFSSRSTLECEDFSQTVFSPTSTIFVSSPAVTAQSRSLFSPPSVSSEWDFESCHHPNDEKLFDSNKDTTSTWLRIKKRFMLLLSQRYPAPPRHLSSTLSDTTTNSNEGERIDTDTDGVTFW